MSVNNKDFTIDNGLTVNGTATLSSGMTINDVPISINSTSKRLQAYVNDTWVEMAFLTDIESANLANINLNIGYDGGN